MAGATVTVTDVGRGISRTLITDSTGVYSAPNLTAGTYSVRAVNPGFKAFDRPAIAVGVGGDVHVDVTLQPGEQNQTITVTEEVPAINTTNAQLSATITGDALSDLPIAGHNYVQLLSMLPSFQLRQGSATGPSQYSNGLRAEYNVYVLDGVADQETYYTTVAINTGYSAGGPEQAVLLPTDAIEEFNVVQNSKAEFGWRPGAQINVSIKSGTNSMHGSAFASGRGTGLTTTNAFATFKPPVSFEDFGATVGGPLKKDKLFYLLGYEGQRYSVGNPKNLSGASTAPGAGTSGSFPDALNDMISGVHAGNAGKISPLSLALAGCVITPSVSCDSTKGLFPNNTATTTYPVSYTAFGGTDNGVGKLDYHLNDHHNFAFEFFDGDGFAVAPLSAAQQFWSTPFEVHTRVARAWWTWVPNSTWVNDLRFGWDNILISNTGSYDCPANPAPANGLVDNQWVPGANAPDYAKQFNFVSGGAPQCGSPGNSAIPTVTINGITGNQLGGASGAFDTSGIERWLDNVSWTHGKHIMKFGGEFGLFRGTPALNVQTYKGTLAFNSGTSGITTPFAGATSLQLFLAGDVSSATIQTGGTPERNYSYKGLAWYLQDDWRIFPRLTVNLGLRYEYTTTLHERDGLVGNFDFTSASGVRQQGSGDALYKLDPWAFAPRFGLAWDLTGKGKTVLRTGFNIAYQNPSLQALSTPGASLYLMPTGLTLKSGCTTTACTNAGVVNVTTPAPGNTISQATLSLSPFPGGTLPWASGASVFGPFTSTLSTCTNQTPCAVGGVVSHLEYPMVMNWSLGVQHAITSNLTVDANYVGTHGQHLFDWFDINQPTPGISNGAANEQLRRPFACGTVCASASAAALSGAALTSATAALNGQYPWYSQMRMLGALGNVSWYNAFQIVMRERASHGLTMLATYSYSHSLDTQSSDLGMVSPQDARNPKADYGNASFDLRHRWSFGPSYNIPGKPGYWQMLQGWQVTTTAKVSTGSPINPTDSADDLAGTGNTEQRWTLFGDPHDISGFGTTATIPCFYNPATASTTWKSACSAGLPQACIDAANAEPTGPGGSLGITQLNAKGCYMMGNAGIIPPALGTFGSMGRYSIYSKGTWEVDMSIIKTWKLKERMTTQFRAEIYNLSNSVFFSAPASTLSTPSTFGASSSTPDTNSPFVGTGGPRKIQLGLKILF